MSKRNFKIIVFIISILMLGLDVTFAGTPHTAYGKIFNSDGSTPVDGDIKFNAFITSRVNEVLTEKSTGCGYSSGYWSVAVGNFPTAWTVGNVLHLDVNDELNGELGSIEVTLTNNGSDAAADLHLSSPTYSLSVQIEPSGSGSVIKNPDKTEYEQNETVTLTAISNASYHFDSWSGDATGGDSEIQITMNSNKMVTANFTITVPVELSSFHATIEESRTLLRWITESETNNLGFEIQRKKQNEEYTKIGFMKGHGTTPLKNKYEFYDYESEPGFCYYRLKQIDLDGLFVYSKSVKVVISAPTNNKLVQNFPNPFNQQTTIQYTLNKSEYVDLKIFDVSGKLVRILTNSLQSSGLKATKWDGKDQNGLEVSSGIYFYQICTKGFIETRKLIFVK